MSCMKYFIAPMKSFHKCSRSMGFTGILMKHLFIQKSFLIIRKDKDSSETMTGNSKLAEFGKDVGSKLIDVIFIRREKSYKREIKLLDILIFIKSTFWKNLFGKEADKLEQANDDEYYLKEKDPLVNKFISVPKDKSALNCAVFTAGIIEAVLNSCGYNSKVTAHWYNGTTLYMMKFEDSIVGRSKQLEEK